MNRDDSRSPTATLISAIVPTFRRFAPLLDTVDALLRQEYPRFEVIVADQNERWPVELEARRRLLAADPRVTWIRFERPGVVVARNEAVRRSRGDVLVFIDDDVIIPDVDFLWRHMRAYQDPRVSAVAGCELPRGTSLPPLSEGSVPPRTRFPALHALDAVLRFDRSSMEPCEVCTFSTCNASIRRSAFIAVGGFDEQFRGASYGDDYDLALRLDRAGYQIVYEPTARLIHLRAPIGGLRLSDRANPFGERERVLSGALVFFRHARSPHRWNLFKNFVLRRSVLLRANVTRPWRQPAAWLGTILALIEGARLAKQPPRSRLSPEGQSNTNALPSPPPPLPRIGAT